MFFDQKKNAMFEYVLPNSVWRMIWFKLRFFEQDFGNKLRTTDLKLYIEIVQYFSIK